MEAKHGGKREGAGRKKDPNAKQTYSTRLRPHIIEELRKEKNAAAFIEKALIKAWADK